ncbi:MAG: hypothetical protein WA019_03645, partial [Candidatus Moraniibacteriota bacterium]
MSSKKRNTTNCYWKTSLFLLTFFCLLIPFFYSHADILKQINYQGKLTDDTNSAVPDGSYDMTFRLYDSLTSGNLLWTQTHTTANTNPVIVTNGIFSVLLGSGTGDPLTLDFNSNSYYLQVEIYNSNTTLTETLSPRKQLGSVPSAFNSDKLDGLDSATSGANAHIIKTDSSGNLTISGNTYFNGTTYYINSTGTANLNGLTLSGLAQGSIPFIGADGIISENNSNLFWDSLNNRLGIGTTTPEANLSISSASGSQFINLHDSTNDDSVGIYSGSGSPEGTVSAQIGSIYSDNVSGRIYKKSSGDNTNTGWEEFTNTSSTAHMAKMTRDVEQSIPSDIWTKINFDTEEFDVGDIADTTAGRFTIKKPGKYLITTSWYSFGNLDSGELIGVGIYINGVSASIGRGYSVGTNGYVTAIASDVYNLVENDYIEMQISQNEGASQNTSSSSAVKPRMSVVQLDDANGGESLFTDSGTETYLTSTTDDLILGSNTNTNAPFYLDVSTNSLRLGSGATADATLNLYASDGDTGSLSYTTGDIFSFTGGNIQSDQFIVANSATGGIVTRVSAGAPTGSDSSPDGTIIIDSTTGRMYFRYGNTWHYVAQTAGFQIPNYEVAPT